MPKYINNDAAPSVVERLVQQRAAQDRFNKLFSAHAREWWDRLLESLEREIEAARKLLCDIRIRKATPDGHFEFLLCATQTWKVRVEVDLITETLIIEYSELRDVAHLTDCLSSDSYRLGFEPNADGKIQLEQSEAVMAILGRVLQQSGLFVPSVPTLDGQSSTVF